MTAFTVSQIPNDIDTLEKLIVWTHTVLEAIYPTATRFDIQGESTKKVIQSQIVPAILLNSDYTIATIEFRHAASIFIPMSPDYTIKKHYQAAISVGSEAIPPEY